MASAPCCMIVVLLVCLSLMDDMLSKETQRARLHRIVPHYNMNGMHYVKEIECDYMWIGVGIFLMVKCFLDVLIPQSVYMMETEEGEKEELRLKSACPAICRFMGKVRLRAVKRTYHVVFNPRTRSDCFWCCLARGLEPNASKKMMMTMVRHLRFMEAWKIMHSSQNGGYCGPYSISEVAKAEHMTIEQYCRGIKEQMWASPMEAEAIAAACRVSIKVVTPRGGTHIDFMPFPWSYNDHHAV